MKTTLKATFIVVALFSFALASGCKSNDPPKSQADSGAAAPPTSAELNTAKLQNAVVPQAVQSAFGRDHPGASINTIEIHSTSAGDSFYEIDYIRQGSPGIARYFPTGAAGPTK